MKCSIWRKWLGATAISLGAAVPAQAGLVTFEDVLPDLTAFGGSLSSGGYQFTDDNVSGFLGIDTVAGFDPSVGTPGNSSGQFLYATNNAGFAMTALGGQGFYLISFDAAFLAPIAAQAGVLPGGLTVSLFDILGNSLGDEVFALAAGVAGEDFPFATLTLSNKTALSQAQFFSCAYQANGDCERFGNLPAQFAIDNIDDSVPVPEPGSALLALTALGLMAMRSRKAVAA